jgi:TnpA family transposase
LIREFLSIQPYGVKARKIVIRSMGQAALTKNDLADLINVAIEELVHHRYELPVFNTLVRAAKRVRGTVDRAFRRQVRQNLNNEDCQRLDSLFTTTESNFPTPWLELKQDPGKPILKNLKALVWRLKWLSQLNIYQNALSHIPNVKLKHFATEAMSLDAARMKELEPNKRYTLAAALIATQSARTLDDLASMFIRRMQKIHVRAKEALDKYREEYQARTDKLITTLRDVVVAYSSKGEVSQRFQYFRLLSGHDSKIEDSVSRYLAATFCYGCNLGSSQTANSLSNFDRKQIAYVNQRHIGLSSLEKAIYRVINAYNQFSLPKFWGSGQRASADGTKWDIYEQNLLAEYHIRYGGYGGIGYYHVSDTYIALFSHFIPCGVWEAVYILDGLLKNTSDIQPDTIHADTQGQSTPVFALAYLLGIKLMPRIRSWQDLTLCRPDKQIHYDHIDELFTDVIDWKLIETHLPDMLRVVLSIKAGKFTASTILRKLGTYSRKNRLYQAFSELGRAIRTGFLMEYLGSQELRSSIQGALNKSEAFNGFTKWVGFGNAGIIQNNNRDEQRKIIKYNHLVSNCLIFYNVFEISRILQDYIQAGNTIEEEILGALSPYLTKHINRFGSYSLDLNRKPPALNFGFPLIPS